MSENKVSRTHISPITISIVIPVYAGESYLSDLATQISHVLENWDNSTVPLELTEAIFVNDDSTDSSLAILYELQKTRPWIKIINMSRNFGQHQATVAGILHSSGDWIVTLDEDLQHRPALIESLLKHAVATEQDIVYAKPETKVHENLFRDWTSILFKKLISFITTNPHIQKFNSFRLIRGPVARASGSVCSHGPYFDIVLCWFTNRISSINLPMKDQRFVESKKSSYTIRKLISHARRLLVSSETKIVRLGAAIGFVAMLCSLLVGTQILISKLVDPTSIPVQGWTSLFLALLFFSGLLAILLGIVLEYISVILLHIQGKPTFFVVDRMSDQILVNYYNTQEPDDRSSTTD